MAPKGEQQDPFRSERLAYRTVETGDKEQEALFCALGSDSIAQKNSGAMIKVGGCCASFFSFFLSSRLRVGCVED